MVLLIANFSQAKGFSYMLDVAQSRKKKDSNIVPSAQYNVGRAYFMVSDAQKIRRLIFHNQSQT